MSCCKTCIAPLVEYTATNGQVITEADRISIEHDASFDLGTSVLTASSIYVNGSVLTDSAAGILWRDAIEEFWTTGLPGTDFIYGECATLFGSAAGTSTTCYEGVFDVTTGNQDGTARTWYQSGGTVNENGNITAGANYPNFDPEPSTSTLPWRTGIPDQGINPFPSGVVGWALPASGTADERGILETDVQLYVDPTNPNPIQYRFRKAGTSRSWAVVSETLDLGGLTTADFEIWPSTGTINSGVTGPDVSVPFTPSSDFRIRTYTVDATLAGGIYLQYSLDGGTNFVNVPANFATSPGPLVDPPTAFYECVNGECVNASDPSDMQSELDLIAAGLVAVNCGYQNVEVAPNDVYTMAPNAPPDDVTLNYGSTFVVADPAGVAPGTEVNILISDLSQPPNQAVVSSPMGELWFLDPNIMGTQLTDQEVASLTYNESGTHITLRARDGYWVVK